MRTAAWVASMLTLLVLAEVTARAFWVTQGLAATARVPDIYRYFYPELGRIRPTPGKKRVLLLGGSVLRNARKDIQAALERTGDAYVVYATARSGHSTRDSLIKYRWLREQRFDLVLFYHGVNEVRANNVPVERYRNDYSHYAYYEYVNVLERHSPWPWLLLPVSAHLGWVAIRQRLYPERYISLSRPPSGWGTHGKQVKTRSSFSSNTEEVLQIALNKGENIVLMSFAWYLPHGYTRDKFKAGDLDYQVSDKIAAFPVEMWGNPVHIGLGLDEHNAAVRELAKLFADSAIFIDQETHIPKQGKYFVDICHLSEAGNVLFSTNLVSGLRRSGVL